MQSLRFRAGRVIGDVKALGFGHFRVWSLLDACCR